MTHDVYHQPSLLVDEESAALPELSVEWFVSVGVEYAQDDLFGTEDSMNTQGDAAGDAREQSDLLVEPTPSHETTTVETVAGSEPDIAEPGISVRLDERAEHLISALGAMNHANQKHGFVMAGTDPNNRGHKKVKATYGDKLQAKVKQAAQEREDFIDIAHTHLDSAAGSRQALLEARFERPEGVAADEWEDRFDAEEVERAFEQEWEEFVDVYGVGRARAEDRNPYADRLELYLVDAESESPYGSTSEQPGVK